MELIKDHVRKETTRMTIEADTAQLTDKFGKVARGLFEITGKYQTIYELGTYGCAIAKPTKRMKNALGVDREILVVVSTFADQQQRTIKFLKREIEGSEGRLENTVAIVIHKDTEGNIKLKNWGRDQGISILPVFWSAQIASAEDLERRLCVELYSHDPFDVTGPVSDDANFYGRRDEAIDLARKLQKGQIRSCLGIRKIGKTSIINRILKEIRANYTCTCVMVDCSRDDIWGLDAAQLLNSLQQTILHARGANDRYASLVAKDAPAELNAARNLLERSVLGCDQPLVLIFDEIDYITAGSPTRPAWRSEFNPFWRNLRSVYQECGRQGQTMSILVGGVSTYWFTIESIDGVENAALSFIPEEYLSPLPEGATIAMLRRLGRIAGLQLDDEAAQIVAKATGNVPYWSRKCCSYVHRQVPVSERPCIVDARRIEPLVAAFVAEEGAAISEVALRHLFRVHPLLRDATQKCYRGASASVPETLRRVLRRYGVLSATDELSGTMLSQAFASIVTEIETAAGPVDVEEGKRANEIGEWAEELAALGKRRNILERKLRDIVVNFIRVDALAAGKAASIKDRVLSALPGGARDTYRHLAVEEALSKFNWLDLVKLIAKEWRLFERLLGDRAQFTQNAELINDRFDAHAKKADAADFALYRRALVHIEDQLAKIQ